MATWRNSLRKLFAFATVGALMGTGALAASPTIPLTPRATIEALFAALTKEDRAAFDRLTTSDFRAFEGGRVLDRAAFFELIKGAHRQGRIIDWSVADERVSMAKGVAVMNYLNKGSITDTNGTQPITWLEVASFRRNSLGWQIDFTESQRVKSVDDGTGSSASTTR